MSQALGFNLLHGDSAQIIRTLNSCSFDSMVTDPPAGIGLLGLDWDKDKGGRDQWIAWLTDVMSECLRVLKPGAHAFVWALPRTSHWTATALENAGFEIRDVVTHVFGSGFPKNLALDKAMDRVRIKDMDEIYRVTTWIRNRCQELGITNAELDRTAGVRGGACHWSALPPSLQAMVPTLERWKRIESLLGEAPDWMVPLLRPARQLGENWQTREVVGNYSSGGGGMTGKRFDGDTKITAPASEDAKKWKGWGTALKPANEHWILVRKPLSSHNVAANVLKFGTGAIHIDACRIATDDPISSTRNADFKKSGYLGDSSDRSPSSTYLQHPAGRYPSNFLVSRSEDKDCPADVLNAMTDSVNPSRYFKTFEPELGPFFYCAKPTAKEKGRDNHHPTVKPIALMRYLCRMITPPDGTVFDPFTGSGTTGVAALKEDFSFTGIEREPEYYALARQRLLDTTCLQSNSAAFSA